jgi:hypothetical protein
MATVGNATGHVVMQLFSHCAGNPESIPWEIPRTKADTMQTMIAESKALKSNGAKRAGIRISFSGVIVGRITGSLPVGSVSL